MSSNIRAVVETITPAQASQYLKANRANNRAVTERKVKQYARDMMTGRWQLNGEPIIFDYDGNLSDGQHRLLACVQAGTSFKTLVVRDVTIEAFRTIDTGRGRTAPDVLSIQGEKYRNEVASILRLLVTYEGGKILYRGGRDQAPTNDDILRALDDHPDVRHCAEFVGPNNTLARLISKSVAGFLLYIFRQIDPIEAELFFDALQSGANLRSIDPLYVLREKLIRNQGEKKKLPAHEIAALAIKAWNAMRQKKQMKVLRWSSDEGFPKAA